MGATWDAADSAVDGAEACCGALSGRCRYESQRNAPANPPNMTAIAKIAHLTHPPDLVGEARTGVLTA
jgi:hypothetical protein